MGNAINTQRRIRRDLKLTLESAIGIGLDIARIDLLIFRIVDHYGKMMTGISGCIGFIVFGMPYPQLEPDFLFGPVDRPIGHDKGFGLVVFTVVIVRVPDT